MIDLPRLNPARRGTRRRWRIPWLRFAASALAAVALSAASLSSIAASASLAPSVVASASSTGVTVSQLVTLSANGSGGVGPYLYHWTLTTPIGSTSLLSSPTSATPTFTPDVPGTYQLSIKVTDANGQISPSQFVSVAASAAIVPSVVASASSTGVTVSQLVTLSANGSGGVGPYLYHWTLTTPIGSTSLLSSPTSATPTFTPDVPGTYQLSIKVTDANGQISPSQFVNVAASAASVPSVIPTSTALGASVHLAIISGAVLLTATITPVPDGGTMAFYDSGMVVPSCSAQPVSSATGSATCTVNFPSVGDHLMTSTYSGDLLYGPSSSPALIEHVTYGWKVTIHRTTTVHRGVMLRFRIELENAVRANVSSSRILLTIVGMTPSSRPGAPPSGNLTFVTSGSAPRYEFDLHTIRYPRGTYKIMIHAVHDPITHTAPFTVH